MSETKISMKDYIITMNNNTFLQQRLPHARRLDACVHDRR